MAGIPLHMYHNMEDARSGPVKRDGSIYLKRLIPWHRRWHGGCTAPDALSVPSVYAVSPLFPSLSWHSLELPGDTLPPYRDNCVLNGPSILRSCQFPFLVQGIFFVVWLGQYLGCKKELFNDLKQLKIIFL